MLGLKFDRAVSVTSKIDSVVRLIIESMHLKIDDDKSNKKDSTVNVGGKVWSEPIVQWQYKIQFSSSQV